MSPGHRIKPRVARKAMRRARSSVETRPERKPPYVLSSDPREPQDITPLCSPYIHRMQRPRQFSLPESPHWAATAAQEFIHQETQDRDYLKSTLNTENKGDSSRKKTGTEFELSSPSSYKETSPEFEEVMEVFDFKGLAGDNEVEMHFHDTKNSKNGAVKDSIQKTEIEECEASSEHHTKSTKLLAPVERSAQQTETSELRRRRNSHNKRTSDNEDKNNENSRPKLYKDDPFSREVDLVLSPVAKKEVHRSKKYDYSMNSLPQNISPLDSSVESNVDQMGSQEQSVMADLPPQSVPREPARVTFRDYSPGEYLANK